LCLILLGACTGHLQDERDQPLKTQAIIDRASALSNGDPKRMIIALDSLSRPFTSAGPGDRWKLYSVKSNKYIFNLRDTVQGRNMIDSMYAMVKGRTDRYPQNYAWTVYNHGTLLLVERRNDEAFDRFHEGMRFAEQRLDSCDVGTFYDALGRIKIKQSRFAQAIPYLKKAVDYQGACRPSPAEKGRMPLTQSIINDIGICYERLGKLDSAAHYYRQALDVLSGLAKQYDMQKGMSEHYHGEFLGNLGGVYALTGKEKLAEQYLRKSAALTLRPDCGCAGSISAKNKLAGLYLRQYRLAAADTILQQIAGDVRRNLSLKDDLDDWLQFHEQRWKYFDLNGQPTKAYPAIRSYYHLRDSIADIRKGLVSLDLESSFRAKEQQQQLTLLAKDNKLKKLSLRAAIIFVLMAVIIIWLVIASLKRSRRQVSKLTGLNAQIGEQNGQLQYALQGLEHSQQENTKMLRVVAHDLRSPLGAMTTLAELMLGTDRNEEDRQMLNMIRDSGDRSLVLVSDLLKTNTQKHELKKEAIDVQALLKYCVGLLEIKSAQKQQLIELNAAEVIISADREKLWRVISNLIGNAVKFSHPGGKIGVGLSCEQGHVLIAVADQGIGIPTDLKTKIFDMPNETQRTGTAGEATFGLGLAISKQIVQAHGGEIWLESIPGEGTTFFVRLPQS
jgi:signal transduction histidine kinase